VVFYVVVVFLRKIEIFFMELGGYLVSSFKKMVSLETKMNKEYELKEE